VKPPQPINESPFLTIITPTFKRPKQLAACLNSVAKQTAVADIEQIVLPDHVGYGVPGGLFGRMAWIKPIVRGAYVNVLCDDDVLPDECAVETIKAFSAKHEDPAVIVARVIKNGLHLPLCAPEAEPICGQVDLTSFIVRSDVWHAHVGDYGMRYEGDFDHCSALYRAGHRFAFCDVLWAVGAASNGRPEAEAA
jgi:hypothetical protein